jgi:predicted N-acetyltransferase YhbS
LSPGYTIRSIQGLEEAEGRAALNYIAGNSVVTTEQYCRLMRDAPTYIQDLDLVCVTDDGKIVAFCTVWIDKINRIGNFEPYGCLPEHRRRGNTRGLMWEGMKRLRDLGATEVYVSHGGLVAGEIDASLKLNASMGFVSVARNYTWEMQL